MGLPRPFRYSVIVVCIASLATFALWTSLPEKSKDQLFSTFVSSGSQSDPHVASVQRVLSESTATAIPLDQLRELVVDLHTTKGNVEIEVLPDVAPNHARHFVELAAAGLYDGTRFHRVIPGFIVMGGDPNTKSDDRALWGLGGAVGTMRPEFNATPYERGVVAMGHAANPNTGSSQFFICLARQPVLDRQYTAFGRVRGGMDVIDQIAAGARNSRDEPYVPVAIEKAAVRHK